MSNNIINDRIVIPCVKGCGIGNILKGFISFLSINENTYVSYDNNYILGDYQNVFNEKHIFNQDSIPYHQFFSWRFLILKEEESTQQQLENKITDFNHIKHINSEYDIFSTTVAIDSYYNRKLISDKVYERIMVGINRISWNEQINTELKILSDNIKHPALGISVRTWESSHESGVTSYRTYDFTSYKNAINNFIQNDSKNVNSIFISYDNDKVENDYLELVKGFDVIVYKKPDHITKLQYVIIKMLLLSKCDYFVCNRISTYSELVYWFGGCNQEVIDI
jgi:hypothetical protein